MIDAIDSSVVLIFLAPLIFMLAADFVWMYLMRNFFYKHFGYVFKSDYLGWRYLFTILRYLLAFLLIWCIFPDYATTPALGVGIIGALIGYVVFGGSLLYSFSITRVNVDHYPMPNSWSGWFGLAVYIRDELKRSFICSLDPLWAACVVGIMAGSLVFSGLLIPRYIFDGNYVKTNVEAVDVNPADFVPGKIFINSSASGEIGRFNSDHTISLAWGMDHVEGDTRSKTGTAKWSVEGDALIISGGANSDGAYDFGSMVVEKVNGKTIVHEKDNTLGLFIGENLDELSLVTDTSFFERLFSRLDN